MKLNQKLREIWHHVFYKYAPQKWISFAGKCIDVTADIDLNNRPKNFKEYFSFWLHLSFCQACKNYHEMDKTLSKAIKNSPLLSNIDFVKLNKKLLNRYTQKDR